MFRLVIEMESSEPPLSRTGPEEIKTDTYIETYEEAHTALNVVLRAMNLGPVDLEFLGKPGMGSVQSGPLV